MPGWHRIKNGQSRKWEKTDNQMENGPQLDRGKNGSKMARTWKNRKLPWKSIFWPFFAPFPSGFPCFPYFRLWPFSMPCQPGMIPKLPARHDPKIIFFTQRLSPTFLGTLFSMHSQLSKCWNYTLARKITYLYFCFRNEVPEKLHFCYKKNYFGELISRKLHVTYSFVFQRVAWKKSIWEQSSWKISFQLWNSEPIFGKGIRRSTFQWKKVVFSEKGGGNSVNQGLGKDFYRKCNSVKRFGPFTEPPDSETEKLLSSSPSRKSALRNNVFGVNFAIISGWSAFVLCSCSSSFSELILHHVWEDGKLLTNKSRGHPWKSDNFTSLVGRFAQFDSRFACESRIFSANRFSLRKKNAFLRIDLPENG